MIEYKIPFILTSILAIVMYIFYMKSIHDYNVLLLKMQREEMRKWE